MGPMSVPLAGRALVIRGRIVSTPSGLSCTSQQGGGSIPSGHFFCSVPMIHPRRCRTMESGELKSLLETMPVRSQNICGVLKVSEAEIKSAARRRVRKSRGEQARVNDNEIANSNVFAGCMNLINGCERILAGLGEIPTSERPAVVSPQRLKPHS